MFFRLTDTDFKRIVSGITVPFEENCTVTYFHPKRSSDVVFLQIILDNTGPTAEQNKTYKKLVEFALADKGFAGKAIVEFDDMPVNERFGTEKMTPNDSQRIKVTLL